MYQIIFTGLSIFGTKLITGLVKCQYVI